MKVTIGDYPPHLSKKKRNVKVQIEGWDIFSADHTLALIIHPLLVHFRDRNASIPAGMPESEWHEILDKIIWSMGEIIKDDAVHANSDLNYYKKVQEGCDLLGSWFQNLWL